MKDYLDYLEAEAVFILRECAAQFERSAILFSGGKDSLCLIQLAVKAFKPYKIPFKIIHIDTGHNFEETLKFRDHTMKNIGENIIIRYVEDSIKNGKAKEEKGQYPSRNRIQSITLLETINEFRIQAAIGGARRDEEKARSKERIFSFRNEFGSWDPKNQRPELWKIYNGKIHEGEGIRIFPLSNWTELDVWNYIEREKMSVPSIYFTHQRECIRRQDGVWLANSPFITPGPKDQISLEEVRFRTVGDMTCTSPVFSKANTIKEIIHDIKISSTSERASRVDDARGDSAMEERKKEGYF
jgi:sulfate adenylyltransferase subunit 2